MSKRNASSNIKRGDIKMCGINGITVPKAEERVKAMNLVTQRRGPEGSNVWSNDKVTFGHNLLATMGQIEDSTQPIHYLDSSLVFNGAIFNWKELDEWQSKVDTEVLIKGLHHYGIDFLDKCEGMWAFAWQKDDNLVLCRDPFGIKPLMYRETNEGIIFSSSPHALENSNNKLNLFAFGMFRDFGYVPGPMTLIDGIFKLVPGEVLIYDHNTKKSTSKSLWKQKFETSEYTVENFQNKLEKAVSLSSICSRNRGVFLSGGLDSTSVMHYLGPRDSYKTFTTRYSPSDDALYNNDADCALMLADEYGLTHTELKVTSDSFVNHFEESIEALEMPTYNKNTPSYLMINKVMRNKDVIITYSGDGGDEMYTGYVTHSRYKRDEDVFKAHHEAISWKRAKRVQVASARDEYSGTKGYCEYMRDWFPTHMFTDDFLNNCLFVEMLTRVSEDFLARNDRFGAYFGMEGRFPLLNKEYYNYIMGIPSEVKMQQPKDKRWNDGEYKYLAREGLKGVLPEYITGKIKTGWSIPDAQWKRTEGVRKAALSKVGNSIDNLVNWNANIGGKTVYSVGYFKEWARRYNVSL